MSRKKREKRGDRCYATENGRRLSGRTDRRTDKERAGLVCGHERSSSPSIQMKSINMSSLSSGFIIWIRTPILDGTGGSISGSHFRRHIPIFFFPFPFRITKYRI